MRRSWFGVWVVGALACGSAARPPLPPAGAPDDDGAGVLAAMSVKVTLAGADDDLGDDPRGHAPRRPGYDPLAYAGYGYGGFGYGGFGYGGVGYGQALGSLGFGRRLEVRRNGGRRSGPASYATVAIGGPGAIEGQLRWDRASGVAWPPGCANARTAVAGAPVAGAIVYLEDVSRGRLEQVTAPGLIVADACGLTPAAQVVSTVAPVVQLESHRDTPQRLTATAVAASAFELDPGGRIERSLDVTRPTQVRDAAGASAWVVPIPHPYATITDERGRFALDQVPAGRYTLVAWSPPLVISVGGDGPVWSAPVVARRAVVVTDGAVTTTAVALTP